MKSLRTQEGNYLVSDNNFCAYFDKNFNPLRSATEREWDWAESTWDCEVEEISNSKLEKYFKYKEAEYLSKLENIADLDILYKKIQDEASKLRLTEHHGSAPGSDYECYMVFGNEDEHYDTLVEFLAAKKQEILEGWNDTVAFLEVTGHINYTYDKDELRLTTTKLNSGNVLCELTRYEHFYEWDGRNSSEGVNKIKNNFILYYI